MAKYQHQLNSILISISIALCINNESSDQTTIYHDAFDNEFIPRMKSSIFKQDNLMLNEKYEFYSPMLFIKLASDTILKALHKLDSNITHFNVY